jgi:hypothetical protein
MLRVVALYKSHPTLVRVLYAALFASYTVTLGLLLRAQVFLAGQFIHSPNFLTQPYSSSTLGSFVYSETLGICATASRPKTLAAVFYAPLIFDLSLFCLTIYHMRKERLSQLDHVLPLLKVLYRGAYA